MGSNTKALLISKTTLLIQPSFAKTGRAVFESSAPNSTNVWNSAWNPSGCSSTSDDYVRPFCSLFVGRKKNKNLIRIHSPFWCP